MLFNKIFVLLKFIW